MTSRDEFLRPDFVPSAGEVREAALRLRDVAVRTRLLHSGPLSALLGADVRIKCEHEQRTGSFKIRGAFNAIASLDDEQRARGIVASSAGNHGLGVAMAAQLLGTTATVFVPADAPRVKVDGIRALGATVDEEQPHYDAAHHAAERFAVESGCSFINPCAGHAVLAGQGTVGLEILEELPAMNTIVVPVGGGGLVGGIAGFVREASPSVRIIGVQSESTNAMAASLAAGRRVDIETPPTLADGLAGQIEESGYDVGRYAIDEMIVVTEQELARAMAWLWREHAIRAEGSGAVGIAALLRGGSFDGPVAVIVSGGNVDEGRWRAAVE